MLDLSVLIAAHNESATVGAIARTAVAAASGPVLVVADSCTDRTAEIAQDQGAGVLCCDAGDKSTAVALGIATLAARDLLADRVLLLDADLHGLTVEHIWQFVESPTGVMTVGIRDSTMRFSRLPGVRYIPPIGGERIMPLTVLRHAVSARAGYALEMMLAAACWRLGVPIAEIRLRGVKHPTRTSPDHHLKRWREVYDGWNRSGAHALWGQ